MIKSKMSLNHSVTNAVNEIIKKYIQQISTKYDLNPDDLLEEWGDIGSSTTVVKTPSKKTTVTHTPPSLTDNTELDQNTLTQYKKPELQEMCRQRALKCTGTKDQLIGFLLGKEITPSESKKTDVTKKVVATPVAKKLTSSVPTVAIRRNQHGNHEHPDTRLVFDKKTKKAIGKQNEDGSIEDLTSEDIDTCNKWKFQYTIPSNLDKKTKLTDVKVDELEDDEILESDEEELPIEEEEIAEEELLEEEDEEFDEEEYEDEDYE